MNIAKLSKTSVAAPPMEWIQEDGTVEILNMKFNPKFLTPELEAELNRSTEKGFASDPLVNMTAIMLKEWDMTRTVWATKDGKPLRADGEGRLFYPEVIMEPVVVPGKGKAKPTIEQQQKRDGSGLLVYPQVPQDEDGNPLDPELIQIEVPFKPIKSNFKKMAVEDLAKIINHLFGATSPNPKTE